VRGLCIVAAATAVALTGCDAGSAPREAPVTPIVEATPARSFVPAVRERLPEVAVDRRDEEIQAIADRACAALAGDQEAAEVLAATESRSATARQLVRLAIDTTCPDQDRRIGEF
jgi:hypothetical protein